MDDNLTLVKTWFETADVPTQDQFYRTFDLLVTEKPRLRPLFSSSSLSVEVVGGSSIKVTFNGLWSIHKGYSSNASRICSIADGQEIEFASGQDVLIPRTYLDTLSATDDIDIAQLVVESQTGRKFRDSHVVLCGGQASSGNIFDLRGIILDFLDTTQTTLPLSQADLDGNIFDLPAGAGIDAIASFLLNLALTEGPQIDTLEFDEILRELSVLDNTGKLLTVQIPENSRTEYLKFSHKDYALLSTYDVTFADANFASKIIVINTVTQEKVFEWVPTLDLVGAFKYTMAIVLWRNNRGSQDLFFTARNEPGFNNNPGSSRLFKVSNVVINFAEEKLEWEYVEHVELPNNYFYQANDSEHIYYISNNPSNISIVNITGKLGIRLIDTPSELDSGQDFTYIKNDENCLYYVKFGPAPSFKTQMVMARKSNPAIQTVLSDLVNEGKGFASTLEIDLVNEEVFMSVGTSFGPETNTTILKFDFNTGAKLGELDIVNPANPDDSDNPYLTKVSSMHMHNRKLIVVTTRNPLLYVVDPYDMTVESVRYLSELTTGLTTVAAHQVYGGVLETGATRHFPYEIKNNCLLVNILSDESRTGIIDLNDPSSPAVVLNETDNDPINYVAFLSDNPVFPTPNRNNAPVRLDPTTVTDSGGNHEIALPPGSQVLAAYVVDTGNSNKKLPDADYDIFIDEAGGIVSITGLLAAGHELYVSVSHGRN